MPTKEGLRKIFASAGVADKDIEDFKPTETERLKSTVYQRPITNVASGDTLFMPQEATSADSAQLYQKTGDPSVEPVLMRKMREEEEAYKRKKDDVARKFRISRNEMSLARLKNQGAESEAKLYREAISTLSNQIKSLETEINSETLNLSDEEKSLKTKQLKSLLDDRTVREHLYENWLLETLGKPAQNDVQAPPQQPALSEQDQQAYDWATQNPEDPRSKAILEKLGR